jgi:tRNA (guanosine-2'-O-)-methyltransferase/TrmH family RNA methyltransferase
MSTDGSSTGSGSANRLSDEEISAKSRLNGIKYNVHAPFQAFEPERVKAIAAALAVPVHLMLFNLDGNMNVAMSVRTAAVLGCSDVWIVGRRKYDARPEVGAKNYVRLHKVDGLGEDPAAFFAVNGLAPVLVEQGGTPLEEMEFRLIMRGRHPPCFILGSESHGISPQVMAALEAAGAPRISISQYGMIRSLNVSVAASIILYEYMRQWRAWRRAAVGV